MKITVVELDKAKLLSMPEKERIFLLTLGHVTNEISCLARLSYWAANDGKKEEGPETDGNNTQICLLLQILAGKLNETWEVFRKSYFGSELSKLYDPLLNGKPAEAIKELKRYFNSKNAVFVIRNQLAFHYSPRLFAERLSKIEYPLLVYLDENHDPNNLFYMSERLILSAMVELTSKSIDDLSHELYSISRQVITIADGLMDAIIRHSHIELRSSDPKIIEMQNLPDFRKVSIPWFADPTETS